MKGSNNNDGPAKQGGISFIQGKPSLQARLKELVKLATEAGGADSGSLYLVDQERSVLTPVVVYNLPEDYVQGCG